jgi:tRNA threonylcarbamoyladenosine biosynthesis protein TsaB
MKLLAIDTSSDACSVALQVGENISEKHVVEPRAHTRILVPMIDELLRGAGIELAELDALVLGNGPGSFIGMRIGASVAQGICYGAGLKIIPVSSLAAIAAEAIEAHGVDQVLVAQDARMHEVYLGRYQSDADGLPLASGDEEIRGIGIFDDLGDNYVAAGGAWQKFPELLDVNRAWISRFVDVEVPRARHLLRSGASSLENGGSIAPDALRPSYIRVKVAESPDLTKASI